MPLICNGRVNYRKLIRAMEFLKSSHLKRWIFTPENLVRFDFAQHWFFSRTLMFLVIDDLHSY